MKKIFFSLVCLCISLTICQTSKGTTKEPVDYVNPYMGNISHLLVPTYPTVHLPNSMLRVYPERADYTTDQINGLPIAVTSHRGSSAFNISPVSGTPAKVPAVVKYTYDKEKITPYSYSVYLDEDNISVDYAPSHKSGVYTIQFEKENKNQLVINSRNGKLKVKDNTISGYQLINGGPTTIYLYLETEQKPVSSEHLSSTGQNDAYVFTFDSKQINLRYGISFISEEQAEKNLKKEINTFDVSQIAKEGRDKWNKTLGKITIDGGCEDSKVVFYTSLYRIYERMINISEDGRYYSGQDHQVHNDEGTPFYTDDWIWDTYRATHPLRILIDAEIERDMIVSYIRMAQQTKEGWMPTFPEITGDSHRMNGNHAVAVIWDAYCKGLTGFDLEAAYIACKGALTEKSLLPWARVPNTELDVFYHEKGYFPALKEGEKEYVKEVVPWEKRQSVAVTLGTCYDHWCLSQIAKELGYEEDYKYFLKASYNYHNLYNKETGFFHPKDINGDFIMPFDYRYSGGQGARDYYDENNAYTYRWDVPHNPADLINLMGSPEQFIRYMNETYREPLGKSKFEFYAQIPDQTGNVGQFSMSNEPALHIPYLYNYAGQPWMTQKRVRTLLNQWFRNDLMGVPGDEDGGGLSAFVVFSQMGFYPVTPGSPTYNIGSPVFENIKMHLSNGNVFEIEAKNCSPENKYIQLATLNGVEWDKPWFHHDDIINGAKLVLVMGDKANKAWGASMDKVPPSAEPIDQRIVANPMNLNYRFQYDEPGWREAADPVCEYFNGKYYLFASKSGGYWSSDDLSNWGFISCKTITELDNYAPSILVLDDYLYWIASGSKIFRTNTPETDSWEQIDTKFNIGVTDPAFFRDDDGKVYLYWGCSDKDPIEGVEVDPTNGFAPIGKPVVLIEHHIEKYGWEVQGENNELGTVGWNEGPCMIKYQGKYYLQYASPGTQFRSYADGIYVGDNPLGPFTYVESNPFSFKPGGFIGGAGHGHTFLDKYGNYWHVASMKISERHMFERRLGLFPVHITEDGNFIQHSVWTDYPFIIPNKKVNVKNHNFSAGWNLLSYRKKVAASSSLSGFPVEYAVNEKIENWWSAETGNPGEWFSIDLGESKEINALQVNFADQDFTIRAPHDPFVYQYYIEVSDNGKNWKQIIDKSQNTQDAVHELIVLNEPMKTRYIRITNTRELPGKFSLYGFRVFGTGNGTTPAKPTRLKVERNPNDKRRYSLSWDKQKDATGYIIHVSTSDKQISQSIMVFDNQYEGGWFNRDSEYHFFIEAFNEKGVCE